MATDFWEFHTKQSGLRYLVEFLYKQLEITILGDI